MNISFTYSAAPDIIQNLATVIYKTDANGVQTGSPVYQQQFAPPHSSPRNITVTGLDPVPHIVNTYETLGLPEFGQLRNSFIYNPEFSDFDIKVQSLKMTEGGSTYNVPDSSWNGYEVLTINQRGVGNLELPEYDSNGNQTNVATFEVQVRDKDTDNPKGFDVVTDGFQFSEGEKFDVTLISRIVNTEAILNVSKVVYAERIITNDASVTVADINKAIRLQGASGVAAFTIALPSISTLTPFSCYFPFASDGGNHINVTLQAFGIDKIFIYNPYGTTTAAKQYRNAVHLGQSEGFTIVNNDSGWVVINNSAPGIFNVGLFSESYNRIFINQLFTDGTAAFLKTTYRRIWEYVSSLESGLLVTESAWINNKAAYASDANSTTFRVPQLYTVGFARPVDGSTRKAASGQLHAFEGHQHIGTSNISTNDLTKAPFGVYQTQINHIGKYTGESQYRPDMTSDAYKKSGSSWIAADTDTETRPSNYGVYKMIYI